MLSGDMADMFSNLYLAISVQYYHDNYNSSKLLTEYVIERLLVENRIIMERVINNLGFFEKLFLSHLIIIPEPINYENERIIFKEIMENPQIIKEIKKNIHIDNTILEDLENFTKLQDDGIYDEILYNKIIQVGEFHNK